MFIWSKGQITRQTFRRMNSWELVNCYFRPNMHASDPKKPYWPVATIPPGDATVADCTWTDLFWKVHKPAAEKAGLKLTEEQWQEKWLEWSRSLGKGGGNVRKHG